MINLVNKRELTITQDDMIATALAMNCFVCSEKIVVYPIVSQPSKCLKFMTFWEGCFVIDVEYKYLSDALETFITISFTKYQIR